MEICRTINSICFSVRFLFFNIIHCTNEPQRSSITRTTPVSVKHLSCSLSDWLSSETTLLADWRVFLSVWIINLAINIESYFFIIRHNEIITVLRCAVAWSFDRCNICYCARYHHHYYLRRCVHNRIVSEIERKVKSFPSNTRTYTQA